MANRKIEFFPDSFLRNLENYISDLKEDNLAQGRRAAESITSSLRVSASLRENDFNYLWLAFLSLYFSMASVYGLNDFQTETPKLVITIEKSVEEKLDAAALEKTNHAKDLILQYSSDWQSRFGRLRRNLRINLIPTERQINLSGTRAEGVWSWKSFNNEEGTAVLGISGDLYVNLNSAMIAQDALIAHEASHAFLVTYQPKILESWQDLIMYNEGLAEVFSVNYEKSPWRGWNKIVLSQRFGDPVKGSEISAYGYRILNMLKHSPQTPHDIGFFFLHVVRNGKVNLDQDLKECTDTFIKAEVAKSLKANPDNYDLPMTHD